MSYKKTYNLVFYIRELESVIKQCKDQKLKRLLKLELIKTKRLDNKLLDELIK